MLADASKGLFQNQLLVEQSVFDELGDIDSESTLLDMGCGRGRIAQHAARATGAKVKGYNIDESQVRNAVEYAAASRTNSPIDFWRARREGERGRLCSDSAASSS